MATAAQTVQPQPLLYLAVNDAPVAVDDTQCCWRRYANRPNSFGPNDSDVDGDDLTVTTASSPDGSVAINSDGTINFTPTSSFTGTTTVTYTISDGEGGTDSATIDVNVTSVTAPPVAVNDTATIDEDTVDATLVVLTNDSDPDGNDLTVTGATTADGTVTVNSDGTLAFTPTSDFTGTTTVTYTISDGTTATSSATVTVTVEPVNDNPVAEDDTQTITEDTPTDITVLPNDSDVDGDDLTVVTASSPDGSVVVNSDGTINFIPTSDFTGTTTIIYTVTDGVGGTDNATVTLTVTPENDAPVAENDVVTISEDSVLTIDPRDNDSDVDGDDLTITSVTAPDGTVVINSAGTITFTPTSNFTGTTTVTYTITDGNGGTDSATMTVDFIPVNDAPVAEDDTVTIAEDTPTDITVLTNDSDVDGDDLTVQTASSPDGSVAINSDGTLNFTPTSDFNGTTTITYTITDGNGGTDSATATVTITPVNDAPVGILDTSTINVPGGTTTVDVLPNDSDVDGDDLTVLDATSADGTVVVNSDGTLTFDPASGFTGTATVTYTISDGEGGTDTATLEVTVICFARGTMITMADGSTKAVEDIATGAMVKTMDHGAQELRWIGSRTVAATGHLAPIMIKEGAMGNDADLRVSPQHRMLVEGWKAELLFGEEQVLASAKHLVNGDNIYVDEGGEVEYFHMLFDAHEIVYANGAPSESFHPGELGMGSMAEESREEILDLFPELRSDNTAYGPSARTSLKAGEAKVLAKNPDFLK